MPAGRNSVPLEKVLLQMDLSRGLDERIRPEVGGDQSKLITTLENLIQEETGGWEKRPGLTALGATTDDLGTTIGAITRLIRTPLGLAGIGANGALYHYLENRDRMREKSKVPEFSVTANYVASSSASTLKANTGHRTICSAASSKYDVVAYEGGPSTAGAVTYSLTMVVFDRDSGTEVAKYDLTTIVPATGTVPNCRMAFVADRYLHVWLHDMNLGDLKVFQHDTNSAFPATVGTFTVNTAIVGLAGNLNDIAVISDRSIVVCDGDAAWYTTALVTGSQALATDGKSCDTDDNGLLWVVGNNANVQVAAYTANNLAAAPTYSWTDPSVAYTNAVVAAYGNGRIGVFQTTTTAFGGSTIPSIAYYETTAQADVALTSRYTIHGWTPVSMPFRMAINGTDRIYAHLCKYDPVNTLSTHVVARMSDYVSTKWTVVAGAAQYAKSVPIAAMLEPNVGFQQKSIPILWPSGSPNFNIPFKRYFRYNTDYVNAVVQVQTVSRSTAVAAIQLKRMDPKMWNAANFGGCAYLAGGAMSIYDGYRAVEQGFADMPVLRVQDSGVAGNVNGSVNYVAVYRCIDATGAATYSRTYGPVSLTVANKQVTVTIQAAHVTNRETGNAGDQQCVIDLYRTASGGTQYYLCASSQTGGGGSLSTQSMALGASFFATTDNLIDATLISQPLLYRQPGTDNTSVDRYPAPPGNVICQHKDRLFTTDAFGLRVYYSSFFVEGEAAWFNPVFAFQPHGGSGPITGLASMDGRLFIFRRNAIFVVDGDGPPENGGTGTEFSPPSRLATEYGCIDARSMVVTPMGIFYRSVRGIELLDRSLQVRWIGDRVQTTLASYPVTSGALLDKEGRVRIMVAAAEGLTVSGGGIELVYDTTGDCWSTSKYWAPTWGAAIQSCATYESSSGEETVLSDASGNVWKFSGSSNLDGSNYVPWTVETGWIRPAGTQGRFRFHDAMFLGKWRSHHKLKVSLAYDFENYSQSKTWQPDSLRDTLEEVDLQPNKPQPVTFKCKMEDGSPTDTTAYAVGAVGAGVDLLGLAFQVSPKAGAQFLAAHKKG